jgi:hypothetical protein
MSDEVTDSSHRDSKGGVAGNPSLMAKTNQEPDRQDPTLPYTTAGGNRANRVPFSLADNPGLTCFRFPFLAQ